MGRFRPNLGLCWSRNVKRKKKMRAPLLSATTKFLLDPPSCSFTLIIVIRAQLQEVGAAPSPARPGHTSLGVTAPKASSPFQTAAHDLSPWRAGQGDGPGLVWRESARAREGRERGKGGGSEDGSTSHRGRGSRIGAVQCSAGRPLSGSRADTLAPPPRGPIAGARCSDLPQRQRQGIHTYGPHLLHLASDIS